MTYTNCLQSRFASYSKTRVGSLDTLLLGIITNNFIVGTSELSSCVTNIRVYDLNVQMPCATFLPKVTLKTYWKQRKPIYTTSTQLYQKQSEPVHISTLESIMADTVSEFLHVVNLYFSLVNFCLALLFPFFKFLRSFCNF